MPIRSVRSIASMLALFVLAVAAAGVAAPAPLDVLRRAPQRILILDYPLRYAAPSRKSESWQTGLRAGASIRWTEIKAADARTSRVLAGLEDPTTAPLNLWYQVEYDGKVGWLPEYCLAVPPLEGASTAIGEESVDRWNGLAPSYKPADLVAVGPGYEKDRKYLLREEAAAALKEMIAAARADHVKLLVVSGYRPWQTQQDLYQRRVKLSGSAQQTVARPGHSEHQLGTAVDLTDGNEATLLEASFGDTPAGRWLRDKAPAFGFAISFTAQNSARTGIAPEPWHYRYWGKDRARAKQAAALGESPR